MAQSPLSQHSATQAPRVLTAVFSSMPPHLVVPRVSSELPEGNCAICCDKLTNGQLAMRLSCGHAFHSPCWQIYFRANLSFCTCPLCRAPTVVCDHMVCMDPEMFSITSPPPSPPRSADEDEDSISDMEQSSESSSFPVWEQTGLSESQSTQGEHAYHLNTRLADQRTALLLDTGAWNNLAGDRWVKDATRVCMKNGRMPTENRLSTPVTVSGVGHGSQQCQWECAIPCAMRQADESYIEHKFTTPCVPNSDLPALLGLRTLMSYGGIIDCRNKVLYLCGPGEATVTPPPGSQTLPLVQAPSGHLMLPISEFDKYDTWVKRQPPHRPREEPLSLATSSGSAGLSEPPPPPQPQATIKTTQTQLRGSAVTGRSERPSSTPAARRAGGTDHASPVVPRS